MGRLSSGLLRTLRNDPALLLTRLPPWISLLCILVGVASLLVLPLDEYSRRTYISENALLPGQVHTYFAGSEQNIFRGYKKELESALIQYRQNTVSGQEGNQPQESTEDIEEWKAAADVVQRIFRAAGLKVATQNYEYRSAGNVYQGQNVYSIIHAPRGDATEAIVLVAAWKTIEGELNLNGVTLALTLARYFKRWSLWSKDIIFLITPDSQAGSQAWVDAYHDMHSASAQPLPLKSGALQGAVVIEYPFEHRFESIHVVYDGVNGQLPNLDLINTAVSIAGGQMGIGTSLQEMWDHDDSYQKRLETMLRGMAKQGLGLAGGAHSSFIPYHIDAITLQTRGTGWQDEMALGRTVEGLCRSLNNLLEHLHQSFFFYLLMHPNRFVSIGTYLPSAMLVAANFTIMAVALWMRTGYEDKLAASTKTKVQESENSSEKTAATSGNEKVAAAAVNTVAAELNGVVERKLSVPLTVVAILHFLGIVPLYTMTKVSSQFFPAVTYGMLVLTIILPLVISIAICRLFTPQAQTFYLIKSFSLLLLGLFLSALATLNFSLSFIVGLLCAPLSFVPTPQPSSAAKTTTKSPKSQVLTALSLLAFTVFSPPVILIAACAYTGFSIQDVLSQAAFGWNIWGLWTPVVVCCVWWPAWMMGAVELGSSLLV